jgi:hypothetical protein
MRYKREHREIITFRVRIRLRCRVCSTSITESDWTVGWRFVRVGEVPEVEVRVHEPLKSWRAVHGSVLVATTTSSSGFFPCSRRHLDVEQFDVIKQINEKQKLIKSSQRHRIGVVAIKLNEEIVSLAVYVDASFSVLLSRSII